MAVIDTLVAKTRNWVKKTGDAMISGDLSLFQDCTQDMHAADKRYVDQQDALVLGNVWDWRKMFLVGREYYPPWGVSGGSSYAIPVGACYIAPWFSQTGIKFDQIRIATGNANESVARLIFYAISSTTWLPTSIIYDAGVVAWTGAGGLVTKAISVTIPTQVWGVGLFNETVTVSSPSHLTKYLNVRDVWPPGISQSIGSYNFGYFYRIQSTGNPAGTPPPAASFSHFVDTSCTGGQVQPLIWLRVGA